jgi:hypothetical protein
MPDTRHDRKLRAIRRAISDPGSVVARDFTCGPERDELEPSPAWQARAVLITIGPWLKEEEDA